MKINQELFEALQELYLTVIQKGFAPENLTQALFLRQNFIDSPKYPGEETTAMLYDYMELNNIPIFQTFYKTEEEKFPGQKAEQEFTTASLKKYWNDIHYTIDVLIEHKN